MKICLASLHPRRLSGQIESLTALGRELARRGHQTRLVTAFDEDLLHQDMTGSVRTEAGASAAGKLACMVKSAGRLAQMGAWADVIHLNLPTPAFSLLADLLRLRLRGGPPIVVGYEAQLAEVSQLFRGDYLRRAPRFYLPLLLANNRLWGRLAAYRCARYVVASEVQRTELQSLGVACERLATIPNLIDTEKLRRLEKAQARRELFGTADVGPLVGWCGHYHDVKGLDTLLRAFGLLRAERPALRLALAWSGVGDERPVEAQLRALGLSHRVIRLGRVAVGPYLSALDAAVLPYRLTMGQGAFPNMVLEAMAVGAPLIASDLPMLREILTHGSTALLSKPDDAPALAASIARLLDEPDTAAAMVQNQRSLMAGPLSSLRLADRYERLYEDVLAEQVTLGSRRSTPPSTLRRNSVRASASDTAPATGSRGAS